MGRHFRGWAAIRREQLADGPSLPFDTSSQTLLAFLVRISVGFHLLLTLLLCFRRLSGDLTQPLDAVTYLAVAVGLCLFTTTWRMLHRAGTTLSVEPDRRVLWNIWLPLLPAVFLLSAITIRGTSGLAMLVGWLMVLGEPICWSYCGWNRFVLLSRPRRRSITTRPTPTRFALSSADSVRRRKPSPSAARWVVRDRKSSPWHTRVRAKKTQHAGDAVSQRQRVPRGVLRPPTTANQMASRVRFMRPMQTGQRLQPRRQTPFIHGAEPATQAINKPFLSGEGEPWQALSSPLSSSLANAPRSEQQQRSTASARESEFKPTLDPSQPRRWGLDDLAAELESVPYPADQIQELIRTRMGTDLECIHGWTRGYFAAGERSIYLHLAFCPPLASLPEVECNQASGPPATIKVAQAEPFGLRLEVRLDKTPAEPSEVVVEFQAVADLTPPNPDAAAAKPIADSHVG